MSHGQGHAVGTVACGDASADFQSFQVEHRDGLFSADGDIGARTIWNNENTFRLAAQVEPFDFLTRSSIDHKQYVTSRVGDEDQLSIDTELEAIRVVRSIIDPTTPKTVTRIPTGGGPHEITASDDGKFAFVANYGARTASTRYR